MLAGSDNSHEACIERNGGEGVVSIWRNGPPSKQKHCLALPRGEMRAYHPSCKYYRISSNIITKARNIKKVATYKYMKSEVCVRDFEASCTF